jgi:hypothetical protein
MSKITTEAPKDPTTNKKLCIDLCSGLGGFSQAFVDSLDWEVIRIDINPKFRPTIVADVRFLPLREDLHPELVVASPPCEHFSLANQRFPRKGVKHALEVVGACLEAIVALKPKYWLLENPKGRLRWIIGKPHQTVHLCHYGTPYRKPTDLWGNVSLPMVERVGVPRVKLTDFYHDPAKRAFLPRKFSEAVKQAVTRQ